VTTEAAWQTIGYGIRRQRRPDGPWFQYVDPVGYEWNVVEIAVDGLPAAMNGYRILHVSDIHCWPEWLTSYDDLADRVAADPPDLILNTGDYVEEVDNPWPSVPTARKFLSKLPAKYGHFGVFGNHDENLIRADFLRCSLRFIDGERTLVESPRGRIELIGMPGYDRAALDPAWVESLPPRTPGVPRVVLSHYPDHVRRLRGIQVDLLLSGHTHGGQVNLPGRIPVIRHDSLPMSQFLGLHRIGRTCLVVNRGFGFSTAGIRVFCPSEVIEIRLVRTS
jgi:predicted MPP superfamily phosphohydrolase